MDMIPAGRLDRKRKVAALRRQIKLEKGLILSLATKMSANGSDVSSLSGQLRVRASTIWSMQADLNAMLNRSDEGRALKLAKDRAPRKRAAKVVPTCPACVHHHPSGSTCWEEVEDGGITTTCGCQG